MCFAPKSKSNSKHTRSAVKTTTAQSLTMALVEDPKVILTRATDKIALDDQITVEQYLQQVCDVCIELLAQHTERRIEDFRREAALTKAALEKKLKATHF
jgi:hypothetical protein